MIQIGSVCIVNADEPASIKNTDLTGLFPITCGLALRSTVTASSILEDSFTYCLQRSIFDLTGREIPPQEFNVYWRKKPDDIYPYLEFVTLLLLCNVPAEIVSQLLF